MDSLVSQTMKNVMNCDNYFEIYNLKSKYLNAWKYLIQLELNIKISTSIKKNMKFYNKLIKIINYLILITSFDKKRKKVIYFHIWFEIFKMTLLT